jgi:hypothetical protein
LGGVSPLLPLALIVAGAFLAILCVVRRLRLVEQMHAAIPAEAGSNLSESDSSDSGQSFGLATPRGSSQAIAGLSNLPHPMVVGTAAGNRSAVCRSFYRRYVPTVDGRYFDLFFRGMFFVVPLLTELGASALLMAGHAMHRLLRGWHSIRSSPEN